MTAMLHMNNCHKPMSHWLLFAGNDGCGKHNFVFIEPIIFSVIIIDKLIKVFVSINTISCIKIPKSLRQNNHGVTSKFQRKIPPSLPTETMYF
mmetsp:Transcript_34489/g.42181  ORF Transcript_34489/g.42181 Transcript_34489/m.42181 type:complete len:93 (-) Transcript_34489:792-1070(-)